jgi:tellurite resistance protein
LKKKSIFADARTLEDAFFTKENARLLEQLKGKQKREALREMVKVEDETFLDRLIELGIGPETVLALTLVPLIAVAWADGTLDGRERDAIIKAAEEKGVSPETAGHQLLETWLGIWETFTDEERQRMRERTLDWALAVAEASGGFLGVISKVSPAERVVIKELEKVLRVS